VCVQKFHNNISYNINVHINRKLNAVGTSYNYYWRGRLRNVPENHQKNCPRRNLTFPEIYRNTVIVQVPSAKKTLFIILQHFNITAFAGDLNLINFFIVDILYRTDLIFNELYLCLLDFKNVSDFIIFTIIFLHFKQSYVQNIQIRSSKNKWN